jgi:hypothetical protein
MSVSHARIRSDGFSSPRQIAPNRHLLPIWQEIDETSPLTRTVASRTLRAMHHFDLSTATLSQQRPARARST